jgi:hypothetical protein
MFSETAISTCLGNRYSRLEKKEVTLEVFNKEIQIEVLGDNSVSKTIVFTRSKHLKVFDFFYRNQSILKILKKILCYQTEP